MLYLLDANVLIRAHEDYYAIDRIPHFWSWLLNVADEGLVKMPNEIHKEIAVSNGSLKEWICQSEVEQKLVLREKVDRKLLTRVLDEGYAPDLSDSEIEKVGRDPFLVGYALVSASRVVVTKEVSRPSRKRANRKIPDVCSGLGVPWITDFELFRALKFSTVAE